MINWHEQTILAPLTKGGNLPFRRLCVDFGAQITLSEMAYAQKLIRGGRREQALLRSHESEQCFGVQIAAVKPDKAVKAGRFAAKRGAKFIDLNCGCPIDDAVNRGLGSRLLSRPKRLQEIVEAMVRELPVPVTVKIRTGWSEKRINALDIAKSVEDVGATALTIHGRTREQRYTRAADWDLICEVGQQVGIPVIGNGDILTHFEARDRRAKSNCSSVMIARGALIKPWIFKELAEDKAWHPTVEERVSVYFTLAQYMKEHFRDDEIGRKRAMQFLPWHFSFFCRYRPFREEEWLERSREHPLLQTRAADDEELEPLEALLRDADPLKHQRIADALWDSEDGDDAVQRLAQLAVSPAAMSSADTVETMAVQG